ncbi:type II secretion system protein [Halalkalibacter okhensis]|uniref:Uncharacterized protein n=1 Tax=Halalkalibacter okhensis TaxID=333138 RepID=A0A0B0ILN3_9BACI|nr:type II secretion system protein [Halalkalibacter okhensis]KHF40959.1 hypothetical protein LQ50_06105 [Halalkalibacter okhensis]
MRKKIGLKEDGYALILVLLVIAVIGILAPIIISNIMSSANQFNKSEEDIQMAKLEEMGTLYIETALQKTIEDVQEEGAWRETLPTNPGMTEIGDSLRSALQMKLQNQGYTEEVEIIVLGDHSKIFLSIDEIHIQIENDQTFSLNIHYTIQTALHSEFRNTLKAETSIPFTIN